MKSITYWDNFEFREIVGLPARGTHESLRAYINFTEAGFNEGVN